MRSHGDSPAGAVADRQLAAADARRLAAARAARVAASSRRAAAARRRLALTVVLAVAAAGLWAGFALLSWPVVAPVLATLALAGVIVLGRRAATEGAAADARWQRELAAITSHARDRAETTARASGKPRLRVDVDPSALLAEAPEARSPFARPVADADAADWTPIPVPPPAYTLKQSAPRRSVSPLVMEAPTEHLDAVTTADDADESAATTAAEPAAQAPREGAVEPAMDLQAVLARRRAAG